MSSIKVEGCYPWQINSCFHTLGIWIISYPLPWITWNFRSLIWVIVYYSINIDVCDETTFNPLPKIVGKTVWFTRVGTGDQILPISLLTWGNIWWTYDDRTSWYNISFFEKYFCMTPAKSGSQTTYVCLDNFSVIKLVYHCSEAYQPEQKTMREPYNIILTKCHHEKWLMPQNLWLPWQASDMPSKAYSKQYFDFHVVCKTTGT